MTNQSDYMSGKARIIEILKKWRLEYFDKPHALSWKFFQRPLENFSWTFWTCTKYLQDLPHIADYVGKKLSKMVVGKYILLKKIFDAFEQENIS